MYCRSSAFVLCIFAQLRVALSILRRVFAKVLQCIDGTGIQRELGYSLRGCSQIMLHGQDSDAIVALSIVRGYWLLATGHYWLDYNGTLSGLL